MSKPNAYTTMQRARALRERHPDATLTQQLVALTLASFADGPTGTMIRPGHARLAEILGFSRTRTVADAIKWLIEREELRLDKPAWRGSAACYSYIGGSEKVDAPAASIRNALATTIPANGRRTHDAMGVAPTTTHLSHPSGDLSGPSGVSEISSAGESGKPNGKDEKLPRLGEPSGQAEPRRACNDCGAKTRPWHAKCDACYRKEKEAERRGAARLMARGRDDAELRHSKFVD